jgi:hypothetical protein
MFSNCINVVTWLSAILLYAYNTSCLPIHLLMAMIHRCHTGIFSCWGFLGLLWEWKQRCTPTAEVRKILFVEKRRERLHASMQWDPETSGPMGQVGNWVFIAFFVLPKGGDVTQVQTALSQEGEVYSVTASCWQRVMKGPTDLGLTMREVIERRHFYLHQGHL